MPIAASRFHAHLPTYAIHLTPDTRSQRRPLGTPTLVEYGTAASREIWGEPPLYLEESGVITISPPTEIIRILSAALAYCSSL